MDELQERFVAEATRHATGRDESFLSAVWVERLPELRQLITGRSILVAGGAGSIGFAVTKEIVALQPKRLVLLDVNENALVEVVRGLRSSGRLGNQTDLLTVAADITAPSIEGLAGYFGDSDAILNFAASKHVRAERDPFSALRMVEVNALGTARLLATARAQAGVDRFFSVSTDKAAEPVSLMGASKRLMEKTMFGEIGRGSANVITSCRFANVAFSNGSLLESWATRIGRREPVAVPRGIRRFFVSFEEAAQLCLIAFAQPQTGLFCPDLDPTENLVDLEELLERSLHSIGLGVDVLSDPSEAVATSRAARERGAQVVVITEPDTEGEKFAEQFWGGDEYVAPSGTSHLLGVHNRGVDDQLGGMRVNGVSLSEIEELASIGASPEGYSVDTLVRHMMELVPAYRPARGGGASLDSRL